MRKTGTGSLWALVPALALLGAGSGWAMEPSSAIGGGGEVPTPFEAANRRAELADGEVYLLVGRVVIKPAPTLPERYKAYFEADLTVHPWLATPKRKVTPYPLAGSVADWKIFRGMKIKLPCVARGSVVNLGTQHDYVIELHRSTTDPVEPCNPESN